MGDGVVGPEPVRGGVFKHSVDGALGAVRRVASEYLGIDLTDRVRGSIEREVKAHVRGLFAAEGVTRVGPSVVAQVEVSCCSDLTAFTRMDELGLEVVGQRHEPGRPVLGCRVIESDVKHRTVELT